MAPLAFISHSSLDKAAADAICAALEREGVACWIAPRDLIPGAPWATAILHAIETTRIMVLVFSRNAQTSQHIRREVERAVHHGHPVVTIRLENIMPADDLEYFLASSHWMDVMPALAPRLPEVARQIKTLLKIDPAPPPAPSHARQQSKASGKESAPSAQLPPSVAATPKSTPILPGMIANAESALLPLLGPIARHVVKSAAERAAGTDHFYQMVSESIPTVGDRESFLRTCGVSISSPTANTAAISNATSPADGRVADDAPLLERAQKDLARYMGPMARLLVAQAAAKARNAAELCDLLAEEIPSPEEQHRFRQTVTWTRR